MKTRKLKFNMKSAILMMAAVVVLASCKKDDDEEMMPVNLPQEKNIVETAMADPQFSILVEAVAKAGLVDALQADGPFTVFAPTNSAFNMLFDQLGVNGVEDLTADQLTPILLYHVVNGKVMAADVKTGYIPTLNATTNNNSVVILADASKGVQLNGMVNVIATDVMASNGVIHVIDKVLLPPDVVDIAIQNSNFSILVEAVSKAGLVEALKAEGPFTVFAPTNSAFDALFAQLQVNGISDLTADQLTPILLYHVVSGNILAADVSTGMVPTLNPNAMIDIMVSEMGVKLNGMSNVIATDVQGTNGVVHVIDAVILP